MLQENTAFLSPLAEFLLRQIGVPVTISDPKPLSGGASRDTWLFTAQYGDTQEKLVLRRDLPTQMFDGALTREQEFLLMRAAYEHGVQCAQVRYLCTDNAVLGSPFFVMAYKAGVSIGVKVVQSPELAQARARLPEQLAQQLATIHALPLDGLDFLPRPPQGVQAAQDTINQMYLILDGLRVKSPTWEWCLRWAQRHLPAPIADTFVHGDFRVGNLLVDENGLSAVIDWEFGHVGDPDEELGYICMRDWRFGNGKAHFAGIADRETFLTAYERYSGRSVDRARVDWWEIMGNIRWGIICMSQANRHLSGQERSVELASLGRRSAEMQLEALRLIGRYA